MTAPVNPFRKPKNPFRREPDSGDGEFADVEGGSSNENHAAPNYGAYEVAAKQLLGGFGDEVGAALRTRSLGGPDYERMLAMEKEAGRRYAEANPLKNAAASLIGAAPVAAVSGGGGLARSLATQAGLGALYGAGNAGEGHRTAGAVAGGELGLLTGGVTHAGLSALKGAAEVIPGVNKVGQFLRLLPTAEQSGDKFLAGRFAQDKKALGALRQAAQAQTDKPEIVADLGGQNVQAAAQRAFNAPGEAQDQARQFLTERGSNAAGRASTDLASAGIRPVNQYETVDQLIAAQKANAAPLYAKIENQVVNDPELNALIKSEPSLQNALARANALSRKEVTAARLGGRPEISTEALMAPEGGISGKTLHQMKLMLDDAVDYEPVEPGGSASHTNRGNKEIAAEFRARLGKALPGYDEAAAQFSGDLSARRAFEAGTQHLRDEGAKSAYELSQMTPGDRQMYQLGAGANLRTAADKVTPKGNVEAKLLGDDFKKKQVQALLDDPSSYGRFAGEMAREGRMAATNNLQSGSRTFPMAMENADAAKAMSTVGHAVTSPLSTFLTTVADRSKGLTPEVTQAIGSRLLNGQGGRQQLLSGLEAIEKAGLPRFQKRAAIASLMAAMTGQVAGSSVR